MTESTISESANAGIRQNTTPNINYPINMYIKLLGNLKTLDGPIKRQPIPSKQVAAVSKFLLLISLGIY